VNILETLNRGCQVGKRRFRRFIDAFGLIKGRQYLIDANPDLVHNWEVEEFNIEQRASKLNKRRRIRVGMVLTARDKR
jgi:hypothetical protein